MDTEDITFKAYVFDLDGTLLNTLPDLVRLTNQVLTDCGWPIHTQDEILSYVGDGGLVLLRRAAPPGTPDQRIEEAFARWRELYPTIGHAQTQPYEGIPQTLDQLKRRGAKLGVLSNKFNSAAQQVIQDQFPQTFDAVRGECEGVPRKPDPAGLMHVLQLLGASPEETAYVGDSPSDMTVAKRVGAFAVGVTWGYRDLTSLREAGADAIIYNPTDLLHVQTR